MRNEPHSSLIPGSPSALNALVEAAVKPLAENAEQRLTAISILAETADPNHPEATKSIARWERVDAVGKSLDRKLCLFVAAILIAIPMVAYQVPDLKQAWRYRDSFESWNFPEPRFSEGLNAAETLLLGDPSNSKFEQKEALYLSDPGNPAYFSEYANAHRMEFGNLPDGFSETVSRIDPDNSFFLCFAAGVAGKGILEQKPFAATPAESKTGKNEGAPENAGPVEGGARNPGSGSFREMPRTLGESLGPA